MHFGKTYSEKEVKKLKKTIDHIIEIRSEIHFTPEQFRAKTQEFKDRYQGGETLEELLPEAFALVSAASTIVTGMTPYRVQIAAGIELFKGRIAEAATGEGKSLVAAFPSYLEAISGKGVHVVTVNDYLAERDSEEIGAIHRFLGMSVGCISASMPNSVRRQQYACDITYVTNNELGFDYLRDNMVTNKAERVLRGLHYAIIDEADSILIDEARTPLIISSNSGKSTAIYSVCDMLAKQLIRGKDQKALSKMDLVAGERQEEDGDFIVDEKDKVVVLTEEGVQKVERFFRLDNLADPDNLELQHCMNLALRANNLMHRDKDYIVNDNEVLIVDEFTGRVMPGRRFSDGLHQAIEAKEGVAIKQETYTSATITFQNFFNKFEKKCGMTGTAMTELKEFREIYDLDVISIPTNKPVARIDLQDAVYKTKSGKYSAILQEVKDAHAVDQPVLIGTTSIQSSEELSSLLHKAGISHSVLNAKHHKEEAEIVSHAGEHGAVTIATNMAGRGTDIKLDTESKEAGGLYVIGTERNESRRVDNQLRGRSGRQGDPGKSKFFVSLEDDLMRLFGSEKLLKAFSAMGLKDDEDIADKYLAKAIQNAQKKVEANNYGIRKDLMEYDDVMNGQRDVIYEERNEILEGANIHSFILNMIGAVAEEYEQAKDQEIVNTIFGDIDCSSKKLSDAVIEKYEAFLEPLPETFCGEIERKITLKTIDNYWMRHIDNMEQLKQSIRLQAYGQKDPVVEYKLTAENMFNQMIWSIREDVVKALFHVKVQMQEI